MEDPNKVGSCPWCPETFEAIGPIDLAYKKSTHIRDWHPGKRHEPQPGGEE